MPCITIFGCKRFIAISTSDLLFRLQLKRLSQLNRIVSRLSDSTSTIIPMIDNYIFRVPHEPTQVACMNDVKFEQFKWVFHAELIQILQSIQFFSALKRTHLGIPKPIRFIENPVPCSKLLSSFVRSVFLRLSIIHILLLFQSAVLMLTGYLGCILKPLPDFYKIGIKKA